MQESCPHLCLVRCVGWGRDPAGVKDDMNDVAVLVPVEAACLFEVGIPFTADPVGIQSLTARDGMMLSPTDPAGIPCRTGHRRCDWFSRCWNTVSGRF